MANTFTKLYLCNVAAPYTPATIRGAWDATAGAVTKALDSRKEGGGVNATIARAEANAAAEYDVLLFRGVSGPLAAQTINCNLDVVIGIKESLAAADFNWHVHVYVTQGDSDTPRGTLITDYREPAGTNEWPTTATGKALNAAQATGSLAISAGDRLVVEIGYAARNTVTTSYTGTLYYGTTDRYGTPLADLAGAGTDVTLKAPFVSFSAAITEADLTAQVSQVVVESASGAVSAPAAQVSQVVVETASAWGQQVAVPTGDVATGSWTPSVGGDLYACVDDVLPDDTDYIASAVNPVDDTATLTLGAMLPPELSTSDPVEIFIRAKRAA